MKIIISSREDLTNYLPQEYVIICYKKASEPVLSFLKNAAKNNDLKNMTLNKLSSMISELNELWNAGFFGDRQTEMGIILKRYLAPS